MTRSGRKAAGAVVAVAVLQLVTAAVTIAIWVSTTMFAGNACSPSCDWAGAERAGLIFSAAVVGSFVLTAVGWLVAWRKKIDLSWVPLVGCVLIVVGLLVALPLFQSALS